MMAYPREEASLTGRARMRPAMFGRMVLQVELRVERYSRCPPPPGRQDDAAWRAFCFLGASNRWRDATWLDLQERRQFTLGPFVHEPPRPMPPPAQPAEHHL